MYAESECASKETENPFLRDELDCQAQDEELNRQFVGVDYLRLKDFSNRIHSAFVMRKARLAPVRAILIPR